jgi:hypothetical protein
MIIPIKKNLVIHVLSSNKRIRIVILLYSNFLYFEQYFFIPDELSFQCTKSNIIDNSQMRCLGKYNLGSNTLIQQKRKKKWKTFKWKRELVHEPLSNMQLLLPKQDIGASFNLRVMIHPHKHPINISQSWCDKV